MSESEGLDSSYPMRVRITIGGIDCYSVGANSMGEAEAIKAQLAASDDVSEAEVVHVE